MALYIEGSQASIDIQNQDMWAFIARNVCTRELPQSFFDLMAADLDGPLAEDYRRYIRHEVKPVLERIKDILQNHLAAIEMPSRQWLIDTFPGHGRMDSVSTYIDTTVGYSRAWDRVLAAWDAGTLDMLYPPCHMMPWLGLFKLVGWLVNAIQSRSSRFVA